MQKKKKGFHPKMNDMDDFEIPLIDEEEQGLTEKEKEQLSSLIKDIENDITHTTYKDLKEKVDDLLEKGYKDKELQAELDLTATDYGIMKSKFPISEWERATNNRHKWLARKRAKLLTEHTQHDLTVLQALDNEFNPKRINITIDATDTALSEEERLKIQTMFPKQIRQGKERETIIDVTATKKETTTR